VGKSSETFDDAQLQRLSDNSNGTIKSEIKVNLLMPSTTARISSLFNFKHFNALESSEDDMNNEIEKSDVIEIEVPVIGSEFMRKTYGDELKVDDEESANIDTLTTTADLSTSGEALTFPVEASTRPTTFKNTLETTTQVGDLADVSMTTMSDENRNNVRNIYYEDIQSVESKLMEQWKAADSLIDASYEIESFTTERPRVHPKFPFNVKIVVNNEEKRKSCKSKTSCSQVSFAGSRQRDIDPQFYADYSDEDLTYRIIPERYHDQPNDIRSRNAKRAANDIITPAPRFPPLPAVRGIPLRKPDFIERLENESSLERSERVNKNLDNLMRFISVWAQVDKFVSDRARSAIKRIAYLTDDYDDFTLGSRRRVDRIEPKRSIDEPFT
jgi:hypothetical protein